MLGLIKQSFIRLLTSLVNASNPTKCQYYPFTAKLDRCVGSCNTLKDLSYK